mgnify:FL=1
METSTEDPGRVATGWHTRMCRPVGKGVCAYLQLGFQHLASAVASVTIWAALNAGRRRPHNKTRSR